MHATIIGEKWKVIKFNLEYTNTFRLEVSNYGKIRSYNNISNGNIIKGSIINGYKIIRLKLYKPREEKVQKELQLMQIKILKLTNQIKILQKSKGNKKTIKETTIILNTLKNKLSLKYKDDLKLRTINYHSLHHRLVADYFLPKPKANQTIVSHLDYNKLNNEVSNLMRMTPQENLEHQQKNPQLKKIKRAIKKGIRMHSKSTKLTIADVMQLKKLLVNNTPINELVNQFKVTATQIYRIKKGENWGDIKAAI